MEHGPLPPHERTWRHPSELAAEEAADVRSEAAAPPLRVFALTTGTLGLIAVGLLILTVTPQSHDSPIAVRATTTVVAVDPAVTQAFAPTRGSTAEPVAVRATPIGDGRHAVVTRAALGQASDASVEVQLPSGRVSHGEIVHRSDDAVVVAVHDAEPGHRVAQRPPADEEIVMVMTSPPVTIAYADIERLAVDEGTAVLDDDGDLVGVCSDHDADGDVTVIDVTEALVDATADTP